MHGAISFNLHGEKKMIVDLSDVFDRILMYYGARASMFNKDSQHYHYYIKLHTALGETIKEFERGIALFSEIEKDYIARTCNEEVERMLH